MGFWFSLGNAISSGLSAIGGAIGSIATTLSPMLGMALNAVSIVSHIAKTVMQSFGLWNKDDKTEDLGDKMMQANEAGIKPENFDKFDDYAAAVRGFELDPEKSKKTSDTEKQLAGLAFASLSLENKFQGSDVGNLANIWLLAAKNPDFFTTERIGSLLSITTDMKSIKDYFDGKLTSSTIDIIEQKLVDAEKILSPEKTEQEIYDMLDAAKEKYQS